MIVIVALSLLVLIGFVALVVDIGYGRLIRTQVQMNAEAAAMAAAMQLDGTDDGLANAATAAIDFGTVNHVAGDELVIESGDMEMGVWDGTAFTTSTDAAVVNAVRVAPTKGGLPAFFSKVSFGQGDLAISAGATTTREFGAAGGVDCYLPLALPSCLLEDKYDLDTIMRVNLTLSPAGTDQVGWARVGGSPNNAWTRGQVLNCEGDGEAVVGDSIGLANGNFTNTFTAIANAIGRSTTTWDTTLWGTIPPRDATRSAIPATKYGRTFESPIIVFEDDDYCSGAGGSFNETQVISGFVWGAVYDVVTTSSGKTIKMRLDTATTYDVGTRTGGAAYGITYEGPPTFVN